MKFVSSREAVVQLVKDKELLNLLAEELMLDELLCGEANPVLFLAETMLNCEKLKRESENLKRVTRSNDFKNEQNRGLLDKL